MGFPERLHPEDPQQQASEGAPILVHCSAAVVGLAQALSCWHYNLTSSAQSVCLPFLPQPAIPNQYPAQQTPSQGLLTDHPVGGNWYQEESQEEGDRGGCGTKSFVHEAPNG